MLCHRPVCGVNVIQQLQLSDAGLSFEAETERLELAWTERSAIKRRKNFWLVCIGSGTRIAIPAL